MICCWLRAEAVAVEAVAEAPAVVAVDLAAAAVAPAAARQARPVGAAAAVAQAGAVLVGRAVVRVAVREAVAAVGAAAISCPASLARQDFREPPATRVNQAEMERRVAKARRVRMALPAGFQLAAVSAEMESAEHRAALAPSVAWVALAAVRLNCALRSQRVASVWMVRL